MAAKKAASKKKAVARKVPARKTAAKKTAAKKTAARKTAARAPARKTAAKKTSARKATARKAPVRRTAAKPAARKSTYKAGDKAPSKSEILNYIAESTGLARKDVAAVFDSLDDMIAANLKKRGPGTFTIPGLAKMVVKNKPAVRARKGINPFTGEEQMFKAKPASRQVKIRPLKKLKDMAA
ncbi:MAG: integration host factor [Gammaproteobacteria bacterium]|nr:MAG: integration host factor [Gammaproteobacteria bacterium]